MRTRKAVITAAGRGTRMFPATRAIQKELLPLIDTDGLVKPTIQMIAETCVAAGIEELCIVVEKGGAGTFQEHFRAFTADEKSVFAGKDWLLAEGEKLASLAERITYVEQPSPEGFGHAVYQAKDFANGEPILLLLGDHVYTGDPLGQMLAAGEASGGSVTGVRLEPESGVSVTGIIKGKATQTPGLYEILALQEKPTVAEVQAQLGEYPENLAFFRKLAKDGDFADAATESVASVKTDLERKLFLKKDGARWVVEDRKTDIEKKK